MRRLVAALLVVSLGLAMTGCGKKDTATTTTTTTTTGEKAAPAPGASVPGAGLPSDLSPTEPTEVIPFPTGADVATITPTAITQNMADKQAQLVFWYDSTQSETNDVRKEIDAALDDYRGLVALVTLNMRAAASNAASGDPELAKASLLAAELKVGNTPFIMIIDGQGLITWRWRGPVDADIIDRELRRATE